MRHQKSRCQNYNAQHFNTIQSVKQDFCTKNINNDIKLHTRDLNQNEWKQDYCTSDSSFDGCATKCMDEFKYSMRSDESLSDFSKSSDTDDNKHAHYCLNLNTSTPYRQAATTFVNPSDCSVVRYPWGYYTLNQNPNIHHNDISFHTSQFPWHLMNVNSNTYHTPVQSHMVMNCAVRACDSDIKNFEQFRSCHEASRNPRPILNRKIFFG